MDAQRQHRLNALLARIEAQMEDVKSKLANACRSGNEALKLAHSLRLEGLINQAQLINRIISNDLSRSRINPLQGETLHGAFIDAGAHL